MHVDRCHCAVDRRGDHRSRDGLELAFGLDGGRKRALGDHVGHRPVGTCGPCVDDEGHDNGDEHNGGHDAGRNAASDELFAPTLGTLRLELGVGLFVRNLGCIACAAVLLCCVHGCYEGKRFGGTLGRSLGIIRSRGDGGDIRHGVSFIESSSISICARRERRAHYGGIFRNC